jgi:hypothetical protein
LAETLGVEQADDADAVTAPQAGGGPAPLGIENRLN